MDLFDEGERGACVGESGGGRAIQSDVLEKLRELELPGAVAARIFPARGLRRSHFGQHLIEGQPLYAVAAAETVDLELRARAVDLEREQVLPLRAADVQKG